MYQLRMLWWRSHAHAPTSSMVPVAAMPTTARVTNANVPTDRTMSVRFNILQTSLILYVCDILAALCYERLERSPHPRGLHSQGTTSIHSVAATLKSL